MATHKEQTGRQPNFGALWVTIMVGVCGLFCGFSANAQQYSVDSYVVAGGGGTSTNGQYSISGTIGQADAGAMSNGNYTVTGGFWAVTAVQASGAPLLSIQRSGANSVIISWPSGSIGFTVQENANVATTNWSNFIGSTNDDGTNKSVTVAPAAGSEFFRLSK